MTRPLGPRRLACISLGFLLAAGAGPSARAAVKSCLDPLEGKQVQAKVELEAKKQALADWLEKAKQNGPEYVRWELAFNRRIECSKIATGEFRCQAIGRPCSIQHVPPAPGTFKPLPRGPQ